jgi:hypothetical protein
VNDQRSFASSILAGVVNSPDKTSGVSMRSRGEAIGLVGASGHRQLKQASGKRKRLTRKEEGLMWSQVAKRKGHSKVTPEIRKKLFQWFLDCEYIIPSPIANDTLLVSNPDRNEKERVSKLLLEITMRELHNLLISSPDEGGLEKVLEQIGCRTALDHDEFSDVDTDDNNSVASREMYSEEDESDIK